ncbi:MAG: hypothetical protein RLY93_20545 [Sumerlaeia bacterium]
MTSPQPIRPTLPYSQRFRHREAGEGGAAIDISGWTLTSKLRATGPAALGAANHRNPSALIA